MNVARQVIPGNPALRCLISSSSSSQTSVILFLHGVARRADDFDDLMSALADESVIHALDFRGHGESGRAPGRYRVVDYVGDAEALLKWVKPRTTIVYGHSLGAMVALAVAAARPDRVRGLILEDPPFHSMGRDMGGTVWATLFENMQTIASDGGSVPTIRERLAAVRVPRPGGAWVRLDAVRDAASLAFSADCLIHVDPEVFDPLVAGQWLDGYELSSILPRVRCPVLVLQGDVKAGGALRAEDARCLQDELINCCQVWFDGCGHLIHRERPADVLAWIRRFIKELDQNQPPNEVEVAAGPPRTTCRSSISPPPTHSNQPK